MITLTERGVVTQRMLVERRIVGERLVAACDSAVIRSIFAEILCGNDMGFLIRVGIKIVFSIELGL